MTKITTTTTTTTIDGVTYKTLDDLAGVLGLTRRGAMSLLMVYATHLPVRSQQGLRRQVLIHPEDLVQIQAQYEQARHLSLSLDTWLRLQTQYGWQVPEDGQGKPPRRDGVLEEVQGLRGEVRHLTRLVEEVARNQAHLLRVVSRGEATGPAVMPAPAPAPAPARVVSTSAEGGDSAGNPDA